MSRVAYQGEPGSFSHEACLAMRPWDEPVAFPTFEAAVAAVKSGDCGCAMIPVESDRTGAIEPAARLVETSGLRQMAEAWRPFRLHLAGVADALLEGVRTAESHPVALAQCTRAIRSLNLKPVEAEDTAGAARAVAEAEDRTRAAICSSTAAELYGLRILKSDVEDNPGVRLRFVVLCDN
ncbi:prephenate dehydratase domain-containing protein [Brevundimonas sp. 2R-24]|uniref:prephenate dehydratase n=1 Tax=Peiella sedimenti TaxID=3061083 RepID=A0ABT8SIT5_9CAUL|nr:prephenate dehydratase domain-containing protein [Caulobacteraceae bacterium XZ-24]